MPLEQIIERLESGRSVVDTTNGIVVDTTYGIVVSSCRCRVVVVAVVGAVVVAAATVTDAVSYTLRCFARLRLFCTEGQAAVDTFVAMTVSVSFNSSFLDLHLCSCLVIELLHLLVLRQQGRSAYRR